MPDAPSGWWLAQSPLAAILVLSDSALRLGVRLGGQRHRGRRQPPLALGRCRTPDRTGPRGGPREAGGRVPDGLTECLRKEKEESTTTETVSVQRCFGSRPIVGFPIHGVAVRSRMIRLILALAAVAGAYLLLWPVPVDPAEYLPSENPGLNGPFQPNQQLAEVEQLGRRNRNRAGGCRPGAGRALLHRTARVRWLALPGQFDHAIRGEDCGARMRAKLRAKAPRTQAKQIQQLFLFKPLQGWCFA